MTESARCVRRLSPASTTLSNWSLWRRSREARGALAARALAGKRHSNVYGRAYKARTARFGGNVNSATKNFSTLFP